MAIGDVTISLLTKLGIRLEDEDENVFVQGDKLKAFNDSQGELVGLIDNAHLTELEELSATAIACTVLNKRIYIPFSSIDSNGILNGSLGILGATVYPGGDATGIIASPYKSILELRDEVNSLKAGSNTRPKYHAYNERVYIYCTTKTAATLAEIWYLKIPATVSTSVDPDLNDSLFNVWLDFAEALCWKGDYKADRAKLAYESALLKIKILNEKAAIAKGK